MGSVYSASKTGRQWREKAHSKLQNEKSSEAWLIPTPEDKIDVLREKLRALIRKRSGEATKYERRLSQLYTELELSHDLAATLGELVKKLWMRTRIAEER